MFPIWGVQRSAVRSLCYLAPILERLHIRPDRWLDTIKHFDSIFGRAENLARRVAGSGRRWIRGARHCADAFT